MNFKLPIFSVERWSEGSFRLLASSSSRSRHPEWDLRVIEVVRKLEPRVATQ